MPTSILDLMNNVENGFDQGRARVKQSKLADLYSQAYAAPSDQRQGMIGQVAGIGGPEAAGALDKSLGAMDDRKHAAIGRAAQMILAAPEEARPQLWGRIVSGLASEGITGMKPDYDPVAVPKMAQQIAAAYGEQGSGGNVQSTYIDAQGNRVAIMRDGSTQVLGRNAPNVQLIDAGSNGYYGVNKGNLNAAPVMIGGQPQAAPQQQAPTGNPQQVQQQFASLAGGFPGTQISSMQRTPEHNREVGGVPNSQHIAGTAGDFVVPREEQAQFIAQAKARGFEAIQEGDHIHLELPPQGGQQGSGQLHRAPVASDNGRNYVITTGPDGTIYRVDKLSGKAEPVEGAIGGGASLGNLQYKKDSLAVQKGTGANQVERGLKRLESAVNELSQNKVFDGGPLDQYALAPTKLGQEMEQAGGAIMPALTALTRVPGVGSQSDWEGRLNMMQLPSVRFSPEVNKRAITGLRQFMTDLREAYRKAGVPFPDDASGNAPQAPSTGGFRVLD
jgi:hypothetical protein